MANKVLLVEVRTLDELLRNGAAYAAAMKSNPEFFRALSRRARAWVVFDDLGVCAPAKAVGYVGVEPGPAGKLTRYFSPDLYEACRQRDRRSSKGTNGPNAWLDFGRAFNGGDAVKAITRLTGDTFQVSSALTTTVERLLVAQLGRAALPPTRSKWTMLSVSGGALPIDWTAIVRVSDSGEAVVGSSPHEVPVSQLLADLESRELADVAAMHGLGRPEVVGALRYTRALVDRQLVLARSTP